MSRKHRAKASQLNRNHNQRQALFRTQLRALITHGQIETTLVKAKIIKRLFDKLMSRAKKNDLSSRRLVSAKLGSAKDGNRLVDVIAPVMSDRNSGFTTITRLNQRKGDSTLMGILKLVHPLPEPIKKEEKPKEAKAKKVTKKETK